MNGNSTAQYYYGVALANGAGLELDIGSAVRWLEDAAEQNHPDANFELSKIYANKAFTDIFNSHLSDKFLVKAANLGQPVAALESAKRKLEEAKTIENRLEAIRDLETAAASKISEAEFLLAKLIWQTGHKYSNQARAIKLFASAANNGHLGSQIFLGDHYGNSETEHFEPTKSYNYFKLAALQADDYAQYRVANFLLLGIGVRADQTLGIRYLKQSASSGLAEAQHLLASLILSKKISGDDKEALELFEAAANQNFEKAYAPLGTMYRMGIGTQIDLGGSSTGTNSC